jgi:hypothetical protein
VIAKVQEDPVGTISVNQERIVLALPAILELPHIQSAWPWIAWQEHVPQIAQVAMSVEITSVKDQKTEKAVPWIVVEKGLRPVEIESVNLEKTHIVLNHLHVIASFAQSMT